MSELLNTTINDISKCIIELDSVSYVYSAKTPFEKVALNSMSAKIEKNTITGIIGHTGSGKSTLVQLLNGLLKPASGTIKVNGEDITGNSVKMKELRFFVGLVFQYPEYQLFEETVRLDIAYGPKNMGLPSDEIEKRVNEAARFCGLAPALLDKSPFELSGGQKRRAAIAGIMAMKPKVLVLDEPAAGLDPGGRAEIFDGIREYRRATNSTVIIVSHSMDDIAQYCDRVLVISDGKVAKYGTREDIFSDPEFLYSKGLDVPQVTKLAMLLKERGVDISDDIFTVEYMRDKLLELINKKGGTNA